ncbi:putative phosphopyruvate hydratase [Helianthus debilis subsp. tardiflorus]
MLETSLLCRYKSLLHTHFSIYLTFLPTGASTFMEAMKMGVEVYHNLKYVIKKKYGQDATNVGDEGGFAPNIKENKEGLELLKTTIAQSGYTGKWLRFVWSKNEDGLTTSNG